MNKSVSKSVSILHMVWIWWRVRVVIIMSNFVGNRAGGPGPAGTVTLYVPRLADQLNIGDWWLLATTRKIQRQNCA